MNLEFDHALIAVADLDDAANRFRQRYGLGSIDGGRHTGLGTGNRIVPLGPSYIELIGVVDEDEAENSFLAAWVASLAHEGDRLAALCLRTDDIDGVAARLGVDPVEMARATPHGTTLRWRLVGLEQTLGNRSLPFFIQWLVPDDEFPGRSSAEHDVDPRGIEWVEVAGDRDVLPTYLLEAGLDIRLAGEGEGPTAVGIETTEGTIVVT